MTFLSCALTLAASYLVGSIPVGYLMGRARGLDIRREGSGNIGATNVMRILGRGPGIAVLLIDFFKGYVGAAWVPLLVSGMVGGGSPWLPVLGGVASVLGHNYTCWLRFRGGKGIATTAGVLLAWMPWVFVACISTFAVVLGLTGYVSLGSIAAAVALPVSAFLLIREGPIPWIALVLGLMAIVKHRSNIRRLLNGTEARWKVRAGSGCGAGGGA